MDSAENQSNTAHFELTTRCDSCEQTYHGKATVQGSFIGLGGQEKTQQKLDQKVEQALSEHKGVGVQRCTHCGHIQSWNMVLAKPRFYHVPELWDRRRGGGPWVRLEGVGRGVPVGRSGGVSGEDWGRPGASLGNTLRDFRETGTPLPGKLTIRLQPR